MSYQLKIWINTCTDSQTWDTQDLWKLFKLLCEWVNWIKLLYSKGEIVLIWHNKDNGLLSETFWRSLSGLVSRSHHDHTRRMESCCVRAPILSTTIEVLSPPASTLLPLCSRITQISSWFSRSAAVYTNGLVPTTLSPVWKDAWESLTWPKFSRKPSL